MFSLLPNEEQVHESVCMKWYDIEANATFNRTKKSLARWLGDRSSISLCACVCSARSIRIWSENLKQIICSDMQTVIYIGSSSQARGSPSSSMPIYVCVSVWARVEINSFNLILSFCPKLSKWLTMTHLSRRMNPVRVGVGDFFFFVVLFFLLVGFSFGDDVSIIESDRQHVAICHEQKKLFAEKKNNTLFASLHSEASMLPWSKLQIWGVQL